MVPPVPSPKVRLIGVPPLKAVEVKVGPLMPPAPAVREAVKVVALPVLPLSPGAVLALPEPVLFRYRGVPVLLFRAPLAAGGAGFVNVRALRVTLSVEPLVISALRLPLLVVRKAATVALPEPVAVVRPSALRASALPVTLRSWPVEVLSVIAPVVIED